MKRPPSPLANQEPEPPSIPYSHDMKAVEFEVDGKLTRLSVYDPIEILSKVCFDDIYSKVYAIDKLFMAIMNFIQFS